MYLFSLDVLRRDLFGLRKLCRVVYVPLSLAGLYLQTQQEMATSRCMNASTAADTSAHLGELKLTPRLRAISPLQSLIPSSIATFFSRGRGGPYEDL